MSNTEPANLHQYAKEELARMRFLLKGRGAPLSPESEADFISGFMEPVYSPHSPPAWDDWKRQIGLEELAYIRGMLDNGV